MDTIVRFRDCACPGTPHAEEGDTVSLRPFLGFIAGAEALNIILASSEQGGEGYLIQHLGPMYIREGATGWNLVDVDYSPEALLDLPFDEVWIVFEAASELYTEKVMRPLLPATNGSSPPTPMAMTSATSRSSRKARTPAGPSSPATSAGGTPTAA